MPRTKKDPTPVNDLLITGQLIGMSMRLNVAALEKYLENAPLDFWYNDQCRVVIEFAKSISNVSNPQKVTH